jgi:hypothetical protein
MELVGGVRVLSKIDRKRRLFHSPVQRLAVDVSEHDTIELSVRRASESLALESTDVWC